MAGLVNSGVHELLRDKSNKTLTDLQSARLGRILSAAQKLLGEIGVERMTMRDLAEASGVSAATLYNRYGTKDGVVTAAVLDHYERAVRSVLDREAGNETPEQQIAHGISVIAKDCLRRPAFGRALMSAYFKIGNEREMPTGLYQALMQSWLPQLQQLADQKTLHDWVSVPLLAEELCDRMFGIVMKWAQGGIPNKTFVERAQISVLLPLAGAFRGARAAEVAALLASLSLERPTSAISARKKAKRSAGKSS